jgi:hypothetical protein
MEAILGEVRDAHLRERLMSSVSQWLKPTAGIEEGEAWILSTAMEQWGLTASRVLEPSN